MYWKSLADFLAMGGYGLYVWGSYAAVAIAIGWECWALGARRRRARAEVQQWRTLHLGESNDATS